MGGSSKSNTSSVTRRSMKPTSQTNPFYTTSTDKNGNTVVNFKKGTAGQTGYNFVNRNISQLLNNYLNPSLNDTTTQAKLAEFNKTQQQNLQNNIISPLANNNMLRSSQATNMYNNLSNQSADYTNQLLANSQENTWNMINNLMGMYMNAYNGVSGEEGTSINASIGSGDSSTSSSSKAK